MDILDRILTTSGAGMMVPPLGDPLERLWRDCRLFRFAPVSEEMILNYVANHDLKMPRSY